MTIRPGRPGDLPAVVAIYNRAVRAGFQTGDLDEVTAADRRAWFAAHDGGRYPLWVAAEGGTEDGAGRVLGWCTLSPYRPGRAAFASTAEVSYYVDERARRRGVGTALLRHAAVEGARLGHGVLVALLLAPNAPSRRLLEREGYAEWGRLPGVARIGGAACDHLIYGRAIGD